MFEWFCATSGCLATNGCLLYAWFEIFSLRTRVYQLEKHLINEKYDIRDSTGKIVRYGGC